MTNTSFIAIPLFSLFCSLFLFLAVLSSAKSKQKHSFLILLGSFVLWTLGSLFMRLDIVPGTEFWYNISALGIFSAPFCIYNFMYKYTESKNRFTWLCLHIIWIGIAVANWFGAFLVNPGITVTNGVQNFTYGISFLTIIPVAAAAFTLFLAAKLVFHSIKYDGLPASAFTPFSIGIIVMFVGIVLQAIFGTGKISTDTIFCAINSICLYYALCKKRVVSLSAMSTNAPSYLMAIAFSSLFCFSLYSQIDSLLTSLLGKYSNNRTFVFALTFSIVTIFIYAIIHRLMEKLFIKSQEAREKELKKFSSDISKSLDIKEIINVYKEFIKDNISSDTAYIMSFNKEAQNYGVIACTQDVKLKNLTISADSPLVSWLSSNNQSITYKDFCRTTSYKSMWEKEKNELASLGIHLFLPVVCDGTLVGMTLFSVKNKNRQFTFSEINFLESAASILAIAFKNASLYAEMEREARRDGLTGLYNRGYFLRQLNDDFNISKHDKITLMMISFDDFRLYNELYSIAEGDIALKVFAGILTKIVNGKGSISRYGGKEFMISLPFADSRTADAIASQCRVWLEKEMLADKRTLTFSAGICTYPTAASTMDELISYANMATYVAKKNGKNQSVIYSPSLEQDDHVSSTGAAAQKRDIAENCASTIYALTAAIDAKDHYTFSHSNNVSKYAAALAEAIGLDPEHVEIIRQAGLLHDIGKIGIPEAILSKAGKLTDEEYEIIKQHVEGSISMIRHLPSLDYVIPAAIGHHERWDGRGYPRGISGEAIPVGARCLCLADTFDAMTTKRSYKNALPVETALLEIERNLGTQFDPVLGRKFIQLVRTGIITLERPSAAS